MRGNFLLIRDFTWLQNCWCVTMLYNTYCVQSLFPTENFPIQFLQSILLLYILVIIEFLIKL